MTVTLIAAILAMAFRDALGTFLVVAEAKGRAWLAGFLDAGYDLASIAATVVGAGTVIARGFCVRSAVVVGAMCVTSLFGTALWTRLARRMEVAE